MKNAFENFFNANARFCRTADSIRSVEADHIFNLLLDPFDIGSGEIDLIDDGNDFEDCVR